ncbi:MAG TPA: hypothetical protein VGK93_00335 [Candidatus Eisenbacteria bacterium]|jgi:plastocyanin
MKRCTSVLVITASAVLAGFALLGCSKSSSPTNPLGGGTNGSGSGSANGSFDSGTLDAPALFTHAFSTAGTFGYHCIFHRSMGMTGSVTVATGAADSAVVNASGTSFTPPTVSIKPGGFVRWNVRDGRHTVTSD